MGYNYRELVLSTWKPLEQNLIIETESDNDNEIKEVTEFSDINDSSDSDDNFNLLTII